MASSTQKSDFARGFRDGAPFILVVTPFGLLFGVVATEAGLNIFETMSFSILVIAGAAQFTALQLIEDQAPTIIVLATSLAVNMRMAMYSASLTPYVGAAPMWQRAILAYFLVDQSYAVAILEYDRHPDLRVAQRIAYFFGVIAPICPMWYLSTLLGGLLGASIPAEFALDFAIPITFIALLGPAIRTLAHVATAVVSVIAGLALVSLPNNTGLLIAALLAMATGAQVEKLTSKKDRDDASE